MTGGANRSSTSEDRVMLRTHRHERRAGPLRIALGMALVGAAFSLSACGSSTSTETVTNVLVSPEQQRADLERAHELGIISQEELQRELQEISD